MINGGCVAAIEVGPVGVAACISTFKKIERSCTVLSSPIIDQDSALKIFCDSLIDGSSDIANIFLKNGIDIHASTIFPSSNYAVAFAKASYDPFEESPPIILMDVAKETKVKVFYTAPADPNPSQGYIATAEFLCVNPNQKITLSMIGTDGYTQSGNCSINGSGACNLSIPGAEAGVKDTIKVSIDGEIKLTISIVF